MKISNENYGKVLWYDKKRIFSLPLSFTRYVLSPNKLFINKGLLTIREDRIELYRVVDISLLLPWTERIFKCGTIIIHALDKTNPTLIIKSVKEPRKILQALEACVDTERKKYGIIGRDMYGILRK